MVKARRGTFHQVQICVSIAQSTCSLPCELQQGHYMMAVSQEMHAPLQSWLFQHGRRWVMMLSACNCDDGAHHRYEAVLMHPPRSLHHATALPMQQG